MGTPYLLPIDGLNVRVGADMVGCKLAVRQGDTLTVSPAMYDLLTHAETQAELRHLLGNIRVLTVPTALDMMSLPDVFGPGWGAS